MKKLLIALVLLFASSGYAGSSKPNTALSLNCETQHYVVEQIIVHEKFIKESVASILQNEPFPDEWSELDRVWATDMLSTINKLPDDTDWTKYVNDYKCVTEL